MRRAEVQQTGTRSAARSTSRASSTTGPATPTSATGRVATRTSTTSARGRGTQDDVTPSKDDIVSAYASVYAEQSNLILYFGQTRQLDKNGDANVGFWFLQNEAGLNTDGSFSGSHVDGDILIQSEFTNGGSVSGVKIFKWQGGSLTPVSNQAQCAGAGSAPSTRARSSTPARSRRAGQAASRAPYFFEGGLNLTALFPQGVPCFSTFLTNTRTSQSESADLKDFAVGDIDTCGSITIKKVTTPERRRALLVHDERRGSLGLRPERRRREAVHEAPAGRVLGDRERACRAHGRSTASPARVSWAGDERFHATGRDGEHHPRVPRQRRVHLHEQAPAAADAREERRQRQRRDGSGRSMDARRNRVERILLGHREHGGGHEQDRDGRRAVHARRVRWPVDVQREQLGVHGRRIVRRPGQDHARSRRRRDVHDHEQRSGTVPDAREAGRQRQRRHGRASTSRSPRAGRRRSPARAVSRAARRSRQGRTHCPRRRCPATRRGAGRAPAPARRTAPRSRWASPSRPPARSSNNDQPATLIVKKVVVNDNGGTKQAQNFSFQVNGGAAQPFEADGQNDLTVDAGTYNVVEPAVAGTPRPTTTARASSSHRAAPRRAPSRTTTCRRR